MDRIGKRYSDLAERLKDRLTRDEVLTHARLLERVGTIRSSYRREWRIRRSLTR